MLKHKTLIRLGIILMLMLSVAGASFAQQRDRDGDGLPDSTDRCPDEPGPRENGGCPRNTGNDDNDDDGDNDTSSDVPPPDTDGDGTADPLDHCPNLPGDGANYGCPQGQTSEDESADDEAEQPFILIPIPDDEDCSLATAGNFRANLRRDPDPESPIVGVLNPDENPPIGGIFYPHNSTESELEPEGDQRGPFYLPVPEGPDPQPPRWVASTVIRTGGDDCDDFDLPDNRTTGEAYMLIKMKPVYITSYQTGGSAADEGYKDWIDLISVTQSVIPINILILPSDDTNAAGDDLPMESMSLNFTKIEIQYSFADHIFELKGIDGESESTANDDGSTTIEYCVYEEVHEVGVFEEVCYEIEIPENCTVTSSEAGVYHIECEDEAHIQLNPALDGLPAFDIFAPDGNGDPLLGMLLPAVQAKRAAGP